MDKKTKKRKKMCELCGKRIATTIILNVNLGKKTGEKKFCIDEDISLVDEKFTNVKVNKKLHICKKCEEERKLS